MRASAAVNRRAAPLRPRWRKIARDLWHGRGRLALLTASLAAGLFALGAALGSWAILARELDRAYLATRPASATLETSALDAALVARVRALPGVAAAEARATVTARIRIGDDWRPLRLFVVPDFAHMQLATFAPLSGDWPPRRGTLLVDHSALGLLDARIGADLLVKTPHGAPTHLRLSGLVWDSSLPPSAMERAVWGYVTPETFADLGETAGLDELKVRFAGTTSPATPAAAVAPLARRLAAWLAAQGHPVREIQIPPPGRHPHQGQLRAIMQVLLLFAGLALLLGTCLIANTTASTMARQVREIGVMKTVGARRGQLARLYLAMMLVPGVAALALAVVPARLAAQALAAMGARNLNIQIASLAAPWWVTLAVVAAGLLAPLAAAAVPVARACRVSVRRALDTVGTAADAFGTRRWDAWLARRQSRHTLVLLGVRNAFRRRGRLVLTLALLAAGGAMFMAVFDTSRAWSIRLAEVNTSRHYDVALRLRQPVAAARAEAVAAAVPGVTRAEAWGAATAAVQAAPGLAIVHTYPDSGHGSFQLVGAPPDTRTVALPLLAGRWLRPGDAGVAVLNHLALGAFDGAAVGSPVTLSVAGAPHTYRVVGVVRDLGSPATVYVPLATFAAAAATPGAPAANLLRVAVAARGDAARDEALRRVESAVEAAGMPIEAAQPVTQLRTAVAGHMAVLLGLVLGLAALMSAVGLFGLTAAMSMGVLERTRELGVMRCLGATPAVLQRVILGEGVFIGAVSAVVAVPLSLPLAALLGNLLGQLALRTSLPLTIAPLAALAWLLLVAAFSALATAAPAWRAARTPVLEALAYD
jgi:putative ABC transport system permease protein